MLKQLTTMLLAVSTALGTGSALADEHGHRHHAFPKDIDAFHSLFAPIWHARPGQERSRNACAQTAEIGKLAQGIRSADSTPLVATIEVLEAKCKGRLADVDAALFDVHEAFHGLIDAKAPVAAR